MKRLSNISLNEYRDFLKAQGCKNTKTEGGHEHWTKKDLLRPIIFSNHIEPIPEFVIKNGLKTLGVSKAEFQRFFN